MRENGIVVHTGNTGVLKIDRVYCTCKLYPSEREREMGLDRDKDRQGNIGDCTNSANIHDC